MTKTLTKPATSRKRAIIDEPRVLAIEGVQCELIDDGGKTEFVDTITEARFYGGVIYVTLAATEHDHGNDIRVLVASRLRMNLPLASELHKALGQLMQAQSEDIRRAVEKQTVERRERLKKAN